MAVRITSKVCAKCNKEKPAKQFHRSKTGSGGLHGYCKQCQHDHYVDRKIKLVSAGTCIVCAIAAAEPGRTRCEGCRIKQNANERNRRNGVTYDTFRQGHPA